MNKIIIVLLAVFTVSCAQKAPTGKTKAEVLFKESKILKEDGRYIAATEKLNRLKNEHPYSFFAVPAELMLADILFEQENFVESAASYIIFKDFHPKHIQIPYVTYRVAESFYKQIPDTYDRDLESAYESIRYYKEVLNKYPASEYTKDANKKISKAQAMIIQKEKYIADFYYKTESFNAAMWRYKMILETIKDIEIVRHSMLRLIQSSFYANKFKECLHYSENFIPLFKDDKRKLEANKFQKRCMKFLDKGLKNE
jgi:outer membrane protein assembly factor BamD